MSEIFTDWQAVFASIRKDNTELGYLYVFCVNKGSDGETRSRFMTKKEALLKAVYHGLVAKKANKRRK